MQIVNDKDSNAEAVVVFKESEIENLNTLLCRVENTIDDFAENGQPRYWKLVEAVRSVTVWKMKIGKALRQIRGQE